MFIILVTEKNFGHLLGHSVPNFLMPMVINLTQPISRRVCKSNENDISNTSLAMDLKIVYILQF